jgi:hypothetical protein
MVTLARVLLAACCALVVETASAQAPSGLLPPGSPPEHGPQRPPLFFHEQWQPTAGTGEHPVTPASLGNPNLDLILVVPAGQINLAGNPEDENNPLHTWSGLCTSPCGLVLRDRTHLADLSGLARLRWTTRTSGFHQIRPLLKLADGSWVVGDRADGSPRDWFVSEIAFADLHWLKVDITRAVTTGAQLERVDLSKVDAIGFIDLMPGSGHGPGGWSDVAQFEIYAKAVSRDR